MMSRSARASALPPQQEEPAYSELQDRHQRSVTFNPTASGKGTRAAAPLRSSRLRPVSPGRHQSPPLALTREVETLRRQVELLHADIEKRAEEEGRLQHINLQLRERLEQFRQQNVDNVNRAESELVSLQEQLTKENEVRQTLQNRLESVEKEKQQLQERATRTDPTVELNWKTQVQELSQRKSALEEEVLRSRDESLRVERQLSETASKLRQAVKEAEWVKTKADEYSIELRFYAQLEAKQELASEHYAKRLKRRVWSLVRQAIRKAKYFQHILARRSEEYHQTLIQLCLMAWKDHQRRNYAIKLKLQARQQLRCWQFLHAWSVSVLMTKRGIRSKQRRANQWLRQCLGAWMQYRKIRHTRHQQRIKGDYLRARALLRTNFRLWKVYPNRFDLDTETERRLTRLAVLHRIGSLRNKGIRAWRKWIKTFARVRRDKERYATNIYHSSLLSRGLRCLHLAVEMHRDERRRNRQLNQRYLNRTMKRCMTLWSKHCKQQSRKMKLIKKQNRFNMKRRFKSWRGQLLELVLNRRFLAVAETVAHKHLSRSTFKRWRKHLHNMRRLRALEQKTIKHIQVNLTRNVLTKWRLQAYQSRQDKHTRREEMLGVMRQGLHRWIQFRARKRLSRRRHKEALRFRRQWVRTHACFLLEGWHRYLKRKQRYRQLACLVGRRRELLVCRALVQEWQSNVRRALKTSFVDMKAHCAKLQDSLQLQSNRVTSVDIENLELVDRLHELSAEMAKMKLQIQERDNQLVESRHAFERMVVREESLKTELARFRISEEDWAQQVKTLEQLLRERMESIDEESANKKLHELSSNKVVNSLKEELEHNKQTLRTVEERLKQCRQQKEDSVREHEEKLQAAFEMASQLRNVVLEKDRVIEELQAHVQELDVRLSDSSSRVAASGQALVQSVSARDGRIEDLQSQIANLTMQLQQAQVVSNQWQVQAEDREGEIRKLRYEVQLLADREDQRTDTFLNQLANSQAVGSGLNQFTSTNPTFMHHRPATTTYGTGYGLPDQDRFDYGAAQDTEIYRDYNNNPYSAMNQPVGSTQPYPYGSLYSPQLPQRDTVSFSPVQPTGNVTSTAAAYIPEKPFGFVDAVPVPAVPSDNRDLHDEIHQLQERIMNRLRSPKSVVGSTTDYHQQQHPVISEFRLDPVTASTVSTSAAPVAVDIPIPVSTSTSLRASTTYPRISYQSSTTVSQPTAVSSSTVGSIPTPYPSLTANFPQFSSLLGSVPASTLSSAVATESTQVPVSSSLSGFDMEAPRGSRAFTADLVTESHNVSESFMRNRESTRSELDRKLDDLAAKLKSVRSPDTDPVAPRTSSLAQLTQRFDQLERKLSIAAGSESGASEPSRGPDQPEST
eukprot:GILK01008996.1.p1 GENE.GILK01008996.1~~GILK01008996.1.p1  ORF type:complete len:1358 (-),score=331.30 GILK01008996.1:54-4127(-)